MRAFLQSMSDTFFVDKSLFWARKSGDIYEQAFVKTLAGFFHGNSAHLFGVTPIPGRHSITFGPAPKDTRGQVYLIAVDERFFVL